MISKLIIAVCVVNMALSGYTSGWGDEKKVAEVIDARWSVPGSAHSNSRALLGKKGGGSGGSKGGSSGGGKGGNSGGKGGNSDGGKKDDKKDDKSKDKKKKSKDKKKGCDDDVTGEPFWSTEGWWTTDDEEEFTTELPSEQPTPEPTTEPTLEREEFTETFSPSGSPSVDPTTEPTDNPTTEPTEEPSKDPTTEPTSSPTDEPTTEPSFSPSTAAPSTEPTEVPTTSPSTEPTNEPSQEPTIEPTPPPTCPDATAIEGGAAIPCECYDISICPGDVCYEEDGNCYTVPSFVAVNSEQSEANAQAIALEEEVTTTSESNHGLLIAGLLAGMAVATLIGSGIALYFYKQRQKAYGGVAPHAVTEVDTATMMNGTADSMERQTNVLAYDEEAILSQENGVRV